MSLFEGLDCKLYVEGVRCHSIPSPFYSFDCLHVMERFLEAVNTISIDKCCGCIQFVSESIQFESVFDLS